MKVDRVTLAEKRTATGWHLLDAEIGDDGDLVLTGHEPDDLPKAAFGATEYASRRTIAAEWKDTLLLLLLRERFKSDAMFQQWLERNGIPYEYVSSMSVT
jgi:hypothetical protein